MHVYAVRRYSVVADVLARELETDDLGWVELATVWREENRELMSVGRIQSYTAIADLRNSVYLEAYAVVQVILGVPLEVVTHLGLPLELDVQGRAFD